jgi:hypothetical protein
VRIVAVCILTLTLAGCGIAQRIQAQEQAKLQAEQNAQLVEQSRAAIADCNVKFPVGNPKIAVARTQCTNNALTIRIPTFGTDQDLVQAFMADRMVVAEQVQSGKMTLAQGNAIIAEKWSQSVSESQQRANARGSVMAQQTAAAAQQSAAAAANTAAWASVMEATRPVAVAPVVNPSITCIHNGNMTTCN